ncbi:MULTISPECIES: hypothetical protein [unclassified Crossiella]|uniref:hypothetical protein n=1 Tax=unclassified Crossiella TaxID=2620835 RepID=UPI0020002A20|nr:MULTISPECIES: hypothetical protein [unclassified Crossiella]MCK2245447.1 hypothetical protein [Crossiella sp. S99.2]MCK2259099.1 hypothetical protein [Crossiella sp. S99.1]
MGGAFPVDQRGLGGVDKTQIADDRALTLWSAGQLDVLMWVSATSREAIAIAYARAAAPADGPLRSSGGPLLAEDAAVRCLEWLAGTDRRWLVVLDDVQDPST